MLRLIARHKTWVTGATISESVSDDGDTRSFTATIRGWSGFKIYRGELYNGTGDHLVKVFEIISAVKSIRDRIDDGDDSVFEKMKTFYVQE